MKIGILGGGQLSRMLLQKGIENGFEMHVLCQDEPAAQVTSFHHAGTPSNRTDLISFLKAVDLVTFESEFISVELLRQAMESLKTIPLSKYQPQFFPSLDVMEQLQDRFLQKQLLERFKIPTLPFIELKTSQTLFFKTWGSSVIKRRKGGYDGYGTTILKSPPTLKLLTDLSLHPEGHIVEPLISFQRELSLIICRDQQGFIETFPLVESFQENSKCLWVKGPLRLSTTQFKDFHYLQKKIQKMLHQINYVGTIAFELFQISKAQQKKYKLKGTFIVNEIAPRVHNTGHFSLNSMDKDQFTKHLQAMSPTRTRPKAPNHLNVKSFVMLNLIGYFEGVASSPQNHHGALHWYGKIQSRIGRKLGHINYQSSTLSQKELLKIALKDLNLWRHQKL